MKTRFLASIPEDVELVAASKKQDIKKIQLAIKDGIKIFGENYVQEAERKFSQIERKNIALHLIGHLQGNKVKKAVAIFDMIQSVDTLRIAEKLDKECRKHNKIMPVLIEVNIAKEEDKHGCMPKDVPILARKIASMENLKLKGLMTIGPNLDSEQLRPYFKKARRIFDRLKEDLALDTLSMGMSDSYQVAIEEGATMVRIGTKIFGKR